MKLLISLMLFIISVQLTAQSYFTKAVIYKQDGTRLDCFIKNTINESTQQVFEYAIEKGGATTRIDAGVVTKVEFEDGMILERHFIDIYIINVLPINRRQTDYEFPENRYSSNVMVEKLIIGTHSLFHYIDKYGYSHFFYTTPQDTALQKLESKEYVNDNGELINKREFRNQLNFLAENADCKNKTESIIARTEYKLSQLLTVFKKMNACLGEQTAVSNKYLSAGPALKITLNGGAAASSLTIPDPNQNNYPGLMAESFSSKLSPLFGISFEIVPPKRQKNYTISFDALYHMYSAQTDSLRPNSFTTGIGKFKFTAISFAPVVRFRLTKNIIAPFLEAGFSYRFLSKKEDNYYYRFSGSGLENNREIFTGKSNTIGYLAGGGVDFKKFSIHARYTLPANRSAFHYSTIFVMAKFTVLGKTE